MAVIMVPWILYVNFKPAVPGADAPAAAVSLAADGAAPSSSALSDVRSRLDKVSSSSSSVAGSAKAGALALAPISSSSSSSGGGSSSKAGGRGLQDVMPVLGPVPTEGAKPLWGVQHQGGDAIFALACNYPKEYYQRFVGSLRKFGYDGDIVLAVSPPEKMKPGVAEYAKKTKVVAYGFEVDCAGTDNCKLKDEFLGYPDPRPHRTFANIRYALYEYWLRQYTDKSYILILDFRDTFFQVACPSRCPRCLPLQFSPFIASSSQPTHHLPPHYLLFHLLFVVIPVRCFI